MTASGVHHGAWRPGGADLELVVRPLPLVSSTTLPSLPAPETTMVAAYTRHFRELGRIRWVT